jgi:hypothetical protein
VKRLLATGMLKERGHKRKGSDRWALPRRRAPGRSQHRSGSEAPRPRTERHFGDARSGGGLMGRRGAERAVVRRRLGTRPRH